MNKRLMLPFILLGIIVFAMVFRWQPLEPSPGIVLDKWTGQTWYIEPIFGRPEFKVGQIEGRSSFATKVSGTSDVGSPLDQRLAKLRGTPAESNDNVGSPLMQELAVNEKPASYIDQFRMSIKEREELGKFKKASFLRAFLTTSSAVVLVLTILWMIFEIVLTVKFKKPIASSRQKQINLPNQ